MAKSDSYTITVIATNGDGRTSTISYTITVLPGYYSTCHLSNQFINATTNSYTYQFTGIATGYDVNFYFLSKFLILW